MFMQPDWVNALLGGMLIGVSVSLMLWWNGRVTGISGIINGVFTAVKEERLWRGLFLAGLIFGGLALKIVHPNAFSGELPTGAGITVIAGLLVGFGTVLGSGCTSGHGVCGISRLSPRSLLATLVFMIAGIITVALLR